MKIEKLDKNIYRIFINPLYLRDIDIFDKETLTKYIKDVIIKIRTKLRLKGFYKIKVFPHPKVGAFLETIQLEDNDFSSQLDFRVIIFYDEPFLFETEDYFLLENCSNVQYFDGKFYCFVDEDFDDILEKVEFGRFLYGREVVSLLSQSISVL